MRISLKTLQAFCEVGSKRGFDKPFLMHDKHNPSDPFVFAVDGHMMVSCRSSLIVERDELRTLPQFTKKDVDVTSLFRVAAETHGVSGLKEFEFRLPHGQEPATTLTKLNDATVVDTEYFYQVAQLFDGRQIMAALPKDYGSLKGACLFDDGEVSAILMPMDYDEEGIKARVTNYWDNATGRYVGHYQDFYNGDDGDASYSHDEALNDFYALESELITAAVDDKALGAALSRLESWLLYKQPAAE